MKKDIPILEQSDKEILEIVRQLQTAYKLKRTLRYNSQRDFSVHSESVAEHIFALIFLTQYFLPLEDPTSTCDVIKIYEMILYHDMPEITHGDVPYHMKTVAGEEREREAAIHVFKSLPRHVQNIGYERWAEYEEHTTPEAQFVYALDKIEPMFELLDPINEKSIKRLKVTYDIHFERKFNATKHFPVMRKFLDVTSTHMLERDVFWKEERTHTA